jgi:hypothetical protein
MGGLFRGGKGIRTPDPCMPSTENASQRITVNGEPRGRLMFAISLGRQNSPWFREIADLFADYMVSECHERVGIALTSAER